MVENKYINKLTEYNLSDKLGIILFIVSVLLLIVVLSQLNHYIWDDEAFTINLVSQSYSQIIKGTAMDVHPPLHYLLLRGIFDILSFLGVSFSPIIVAKIVSLIPIVLLLIFSLFVLRNRFGWLSAGLFSFCLMGMPKILLYGVQIRMYSWALMFVTLTFYCAYRLTQSSLTKNMSIKYWVLLIAFSVLGAYTHYFALIVTIVIYLFLAIYFLIRNRKEILKLIGAAIASLLLYLPWLFVFINQIKSHQSSHSSQFLLNELPNFLWFIFSPNIERTYGAISIIGLALIISYVVLLVYLFNNSKKFDSKFVYLGPFIVLGTMILTFFVSKSNFAPRYMFIALGVFWLSFSLLLSKSFSKKKIFIPIFVILLISSALNVGLFFEQQNEHDKVFNQVNAVLGEINSNDLLVFTNIDVYVSFNKPFLKNNSNIYYNIDHNFYENKLKNRGNYTYSGFTETKMDNINGTYEEHQLNGINEIKKALSQNKTVWIFTRNTEKEVNMDIMSKLPNSYKLTKKLVIKEKYPDEALPYPKNIFVISKTE